MAQPTADPATHWLTEERIRVYSLLMVVIFGLGFIALIAVSLPNLVDPRGKPLGYDFMAFWSAARLALAGHPAAAFDADAISAVQHAAVPALADIWFPWHYPPTCLLAVLPLGLLPYPVALAAFMVGSCALWWALIRRLLVDPRAWLVAAATPAGLFNLFDGQNAFLTAALAGFALLWLDRRPIAAGVLIGLLAIKPHLALLFPIALVAGGYWRSFATAAATVTLFLIASVAVLGADSLSAFIDHLPVSQEMADHGAVPWAWMPSVYVLALSLGAAPSLAMPAQVVAALAAAVCVWRVWRRDEAPFETRAAVLLAGSLLVSPYLFTYDQTWVAVAIAFLAILGMRDGFRRGERNWLFAAWLAPLGFVPLYWLWGVQAGCVAPAIVLAIAWRRATAPPSSFRPR
jgi:hypothetical protein